MTSAPASRATSTRAPPRPRSAVSRERTSRPRSKPREASSPKRLLLRAPPHERALPRGQLGDDEVVAVFEQVEHHLPGQGAIERDGDPVALVQVIAGLDRG